MERRISGYTGIVVNGVTYGVTELPNRKALCLYRQESGVIQPVAYFRNDADALAFRDWLMQFGRFARGESE